MLKRQLAILGMITALLLMTGCASVPKEVVELSYKTGQDMASLQASYDRLIHEFYEQLRAQRLDYLDNTWTPMFIEEMVTKGHLVNIAKGEEILTEEGFVAPSPNPDIARQQLLANIKDWSDATIKKIEAKRKALLLPLYQEEDTLRAEVGHAFNQLMQANAAVTAHLNSLREVQEVQDQALQALNIDGLRAKISNALVTASDKAARGLVKIREADGFVEEAEVFLQQNLNLPSPAPPVPTGSN